jgi:hypothetical protein
MNGANHTLIASIVFAAFASTFFVGCYFNRDDRWGYDHSRDYSYYDRDHYYDRDRYDGDRYYDRDRYNDRDWRSDRYDRWNDYRDRDDSRRWSRTNPIDPLRSHYND